MDKCSSTRKAEYRVNFESRFCTPWRHSRMAFLDSSLRGNDGGLTPSFESTGAVMRAKAGIQSSCCSRENYSNAHYQTLASSASIPENSSHEHETHSPLALHRWFVFGFD